MTLIDRAMPVLSGDASQERVERNANALRSRTFSFVVALNAAIGLALGYCYRSDIFLWLTIWEVNRARANPPWNRMAQARGMEFGTAPFPIGKDDIAKRGDLLGHTTARLIGAYGELCARWLMFLAVTPPNWRVIDDIRIGPNIIEMIAAHENIANPAIGVRRFLEGSDHEQYAQ